VLVSALGATLVGFALLVLALATGMLWLAVACIVICVIGAVLLLADTLGLRPALPRRSSSRATGEAVDPDPTIPPVDDDDDAPTAQFDRITDDPVVTLGDAGPEGTGPIVEPVETPTEFSADTETTPARHGRHERHEQSDREADHVSVDDETPAERQPQPRRGRHGRPG
jgi:hypothetical protein